MDIKRYVGQTSISSKGQKMTVLEYNCNTNITVQFEDGTIVKKKSYQNFLNGTIRNPHYNKTTHIGETVTNYKRVRSIKKDRIGETSINKKGLKMTIIAYRGIRDIDVQFEDNTIAYHKQYDAFKKGKIKKPNYKRT